MEEKRNDILLWGVSKIPLVAYLLANGFEVIETQIKEFGGKSRVDFIFENSTELHEAIKRFKADEFLEIYNKKLFEVRGMIYEKKAEANE